MRSRWVCRSARKHPSASAEAAVVERSVGHVESGELADGRLELEDALQRPLADLGLVGRVGGRELGPAGQGRAPPRAGSAARSRLPGSSADRAGCCARRVPARSRAPRVRRGRGGGAGRRCAVRGGWDRTTPRWRTRLPQRASPGGRRPCGTGSSRPGPGIGGVAVLREVHAVRGRGGARGDRRHAPAVEGPLDDAGRDAPVAAGDDDLGADLGEEWEHAAQGDRDGPAPGCRCPT